MSDSDRHDEFFEELAATTDLAPGPSLRAPSRLKSRIYSALIGKQQQSGPLLDLKETKQNLRGLCVFEELVRITPLGGRAQTLNYCSVCHARVLAEKLEKAPIWWPNCPYAEFQKR